MKKLTLNNEQLVTIQQALRFALDFDTDYYTLAPKGNTGKPDLEREDIDYNQGSDFLQERRWKAGYQLLKDIL